MDKDYEIHIRNKAILSYRSPMAAERLAEYLAEEILCKDRLLWLKERIERLLEKLDKVERALVEIRYFGRKKRMGEFLKAESEGGWSERKYFRMQDKLGEKLESLLHGLGVTKEVYLRDFEQTEIFKTVRKKAARISSVAERFAAV